MAGSQVGELSLTTTCGSFHRVFDSRQPRFLCTGSYVCSSSAANIPLARSLLGCLMDRDRWSVSNQALTSSVIGCPRAFREGVLPLN